MHRPLRLALLLAALHTGGAQAQAKSIDIAAQDLSGALTALASQGGIQLLFSTDELKGARSAAVRAAPGPEEALQRLLDGSGFTFVRSGPGSYVIRRRPPAGQSATVLPEVVVTSAAERGYKADKVAVAGKIPLSPREIPNSVSVLTREQIEEQGLVTMQDGLQQVTGINVVANDTSNAQYWARGYGLGVMYDGVASYNGMTPSHQFDLALYERIEVLRGPAGLLRGVGEPGGVVNLVKKRPQEQFGFAWSAGAGSWNNYRAEADVTGPLNEERSLRGRLVVANEDRGYFYDHTHGRKWLAMGALEYALSPATRFSLSFTAQDADVRAPWSGLPTSSAKDAEGHFRLLDVDRSTFHAPEWGRMLYHTEESSAAAEHRFDNGWLAKASLNHREWRQDYKYAYSYSSVDVSTKRLDYRTTRGDGDYARDGIDLYASGPFQWLGRQHRLLFGFNAEEYRYRSKSGSGPVISGVLFGDLSPLAEPDIAYTSGKENSTVQSGFYTQLRLSLADPLTLVAGARTTSFENRYHNVAPSKAQAWIRGAKADNEVTPYAGLLFDISREVTLYASYADIFVPQTQAKTGGGVLDPRVGRQYEIGSKADLLDGRLAASLALFDIRDRNRAYLDLVGDPDGNSYLNAGEVESKGWELEFAGKPLRGLDLSAGYTNLSTTYLKDKDNEGKSYSIFSPRHQYKLWSNYRFAADGELAGFSVGLGLIAQSRAQSTRGWRDEVVNTAYTVVNGRIGYQIDARHSVSLAVNNLFDRKYYASVGTPNNYNFYGEPRSLMLTLRGSY